MAGYHKQCACGRYDDEVPCRRCLEAEVGRLRTPVTDISIGKLPYQEHPFVHGVRNGQDVWLLTNGQWTETDGHPDASIPLHKGNVLGAEAKPDRCVLSESSDGDTWAGCILDSGHTGQCEIRARPELIREAATGQNHEP